MNKSKDLLASEFALGLLSEGERLRVEEKASHDAELAERIWWWIECFAPLTASSAEIKPPAALFESIEQRIDRQEAAGGDGSVTVRQNEGRWLEIAPGARRKHLYYDQRSGSEAFLIDLDPGATLPEHDHDGTEDCMVIAGEFIIGDLRLKAGDFHAAFADSHHAPCRSESGCRLFVKAAA